MNFLVQQHSTFASRCFPLGDPRHVLKPAADTWSSLCSCLFSLLAAVANLVPIPNFPKVSTLCGAFGLVHKHNNPTCCTQLQHVALMCSCARASLVAAVANLSHPQKKQPPKRWCSVRFKIAVYINSIAILQKHAFLIGNNIPFLRCKSRRNNRKAASAHRCHESAQKRHPLSSACF